MRSQALIDAIVRQTTVLIARLSTAEGIRSPLGHIANEVFSGLVTELAHQGVSKKVAADMFGLALRSYRQKVQRLGESATSRGVTLWTAVQSYLAEHDGAARKDVVEHFKYDEEVSVRGILKDLVESGFVLSSGRGDETKYRIATEEELRDLGTESTENSEESLAALVWLQVYREGPMTREGLMQLTRASSEELDAILETLVADGRVSRQSRNGEVLLEAQELLIPIGETAGWEAAVVDHHRTVMNAIAAKVTTGNRVSGSQDEGGGTTLTFDLWPGHPKEQEVRQLLSRTRSNILPLWEEVANCQAEHPRSAKYQVHFYCGQHLVEEDGM